MIPSTIAHACISVAIMLSMTKPASAEQLAFSFLDPRNDNGSGPDIVRMDFTFDNETGNYRIVLTATNANPFVGQFRININLFNPDVGTTECFPSFFRDQLNDFNLATPTTTLTLTGKQFHLQFWQGGDRVATNSTPFGNPDCTSQFGSGVGSLPQFRPGDSIAGGDVWAVVVPPPLPMLEVLILDVIQLPIDDALGNSLLAKLGDAYDALTDENLNNDHIAINKLLDFIDQIDAQAGRQISSTDATNLIERAETIAFVLIALNV